MKKYSTYYKQQATINKKCRQLAKGLSMLNGALTYIQDAKKLVAQMKALERKDQCFMCGERDPKELFGQHEDDGPMLCIDCHVRVTADGWEHERNAQEAYNRTGSRLY